MIELMLGVFLGFLIGRVTSAYSFIKKPPDKILTWNNDILGYRSIPPDAKIEKNQSLLLCFEVRKDDKEG